MTMQRHPIFASQVESAPEDYPEPGPGEVTRWSLATPDGEPVGVLLFDGGGLLWTPASTEDPSAQEHAAELLSFIRGNREQGTAQADLLASVREAYVGDLVEDTARRGPDDAGEFEALLGRFAVGEFAAPRADHSETVCVMAVPAADDPVHGIGPEEKHATLLYFGDPADSADPDRLRGSKGIFKEVLRIAAEEIGPFTATVTGVDALGDEGATVWLLDSPELQTLFSEIPEIDSEVHSMYEDADVTRYPEYLPHVTIGYTGDDSAGSETGESVTDEDMARAADVQEVRFDRLALWWGDERYEFPLGAAEFDALLETFGDERYQTFKVAAGDPGPTSKKRTGGPDKRTKTGEKVGKDHRPEGGKGGGGSNWNPEDHPRGEEGTSEGGRFIPKEGAGGGGPSKEGSSSKSGGSPSGGEAGPMPEAKRAKELVNAILDSLKDVLGQLTSKQAKALVEQIEENAAAFIAGQDGNNGNGGGGGGGPAKGGKDAPAKGGKEAPAEGGKDAPAGGGKDAPAGGGKDAPGGGGGDSRPAGLEGVIEGVKGLLKGFGGNMRDEDREALESAVEGLEGL
jgi:2'-5' RNA ligase